jgi:CheY-like chemotaxis protein
MKTQKTILIADDDEQLVELLVLRCRQVGLRTLSAENAFDALLLLHHEVVDLAILDVGMPCGNGLDVFEMIAADPVLRVIPTIILTGRSDSQTIRRCHRLLGYYVQKGSDVWSRIEPLLREWNLLFAPVHANPCAGPAPAPQ